MDYIRVICAEPGFRRAGVSHPQRAVYPLGHFTDAQLKLMVEEPLLAIDSIEAPLSPLDRAALVASAVGHVLPGDSLARQPAVAQRVDEAVVSLATGASDAGLKVQAARDTAREVARAGGGVPGGMGGDIIPATTTFGEAIGAVSVGAGGIGVVSVGAGGVGGIGSDPVELAAGAAFSAPAGVGTGTLDVGLRAATEEAVGAAHAERVVERREDAAVEGEIAGAAPAEVNDVPGNEGLTGPSPSGTGRAGRAGRLGR